MNKKLFLVMFVLASLLLAVSSAAREKEIEKTKAKIAFYQDKIASIEKIIEGLEKNLQHENNWEKATEISNLVTQQKQRITKIKKDLAEEQDKLPLLREEKKPLRAEKQPAVVLTRKGWATGLGLSGGTVLLDVGYFFPFRPNTELKADLGYGLGSSYSLLVLRAGGSYYFAPEMFAGISIDWGNYFSSSGASGSIQEVVGMPSSFSTGSRIGLGVFGGRTFGKWEAQAGYSTALGVILTGAYWF